MLKALALETFSSLFFKTKNITVSKIAKKEVHSVRLWLSVGLIAANAVMLMSYIYGVNDSASKGYEIKSLQKRLAVLSEENKKISLKVSEASSMVAIQTGFLSSNFVPAGTPKFVAVPSEAKFSQR